MAAATISAYGRLLLLVWVMGEWERQAAMGRGQAALAASVVKSSLPTAEKFEANRAEEFESDGNRTQLESVRPGGRRGRRKQERLTGRLKKSRSKNGGGAGSSLDPEDHLTEGFLPPGRQARRNLTNVGAKRLSEGTDAGQGSGDSEGRRPTEAPCRLCRLCIENWIAESREGVEPMPHPAGIQCAYSERSLNGHRLCGACGASDGIYGIAEDEIGGEVAELDRLWRAFLCSRCSDMKETGKGEILVKYIQQRCWVCCRQATFAAKGAQKKDARHCKLHRVPGEVDVRNRLCSYRGASDCSRRALFGNPSEKSGPRFCSQHK